MEIATTIMILGWFGLIGLGFIDFLLGAARPAFYFKGLGELDSYRSVVAARPDPGTVGRVQTADTCHYLVTSPSEIRFIGHQSFFTMPWLLRGRIVTDGTTWLVETRSSVTFWVYSVFFMTTLVVMTLANFLSDGARAGAVLIVISAIAFFFYRRWYSRQLARTEGYAEEIAMDLEKRA